MTNMTHTTANSHQLKEGDIIKHYGVWLLLTDRKAYPKRPDDCPDRQGECITFVGVEIARERDAQLPQHWTAKGYNIQGNKMAFWCVVSAE